MATAGHPSGNALFCRDDVQQRLRSTNQKVGLPTFGLTRLKDPTAPDPEASSGSTVVRLVDWHATGALATVGALVVGLRDARGHAQWQDLDRRPAHLPAALAGRTVKVRDVGNRARVTSPPSPAPADITHLDLLGGLTPASAATASCYLPPGASPRRRL
jgi:hypothetical protein